MKFVDEVVVDVVAGGWYVSEMRGDGGRGGDIYLVADKSLNTLIDFRYKRIFRATKGQQGLGSDCIGAAGEDLHIKLPVGTLIYDHNTEVLLGDLKEDGQTLLIAKGGSKGLGNARFKTRVTGFSGCGFIRIT